MFPIGKGKIFPAWHCSLVMAIGTKFSLAVFLEGRKDKRFSLALFPGGEQ
jgi:hypothetical protein